MRRSVLLFRVPIILSMLAKGKKKCPKYNSIVKSTNLMYNTENAIMKKNSSIDAVILVLQLLFVFRWYRQLWLFFFLFATAQDNLLQTEQDTCLKCRQGCTR